MQNTSAAPPLARKKRRLWRRLFLLVIVLLIVGELALRLIFGLGNPVIYQVDPYIGYMPVANQNLTRFFARNKINAFNQRSDDLPAQKQAGHYRVLCIGDSMTYGTTYVSQEQIATSILARDLPAIVGKPVDMMNASTGGWSVFNESHYLQARGTYEADLVIFILNAGDLVQPYNVLTPGDALNYPQQKPWTAIGETWSRYISPRLFHSGGPKQDAGAVVTEIPDCERDTPKVAAELTIAHAFCKAHDARMAVVYIGATNPMWKRGVEILKDWAQQESVPYVNYTDVFAAHPESEVFYNSHFTSKGNEVLAKQMEIDWPTLSK